MKRLIKLLFTKNVNRKKVIINSMIWNYSLCINYNKIWEN